MTLPSNKCIWKLKTHRKLLQNIKQVGHISLNVCPLLTYCTVNCTLYFYANNIWFCPPINAFGNWKHTGIVMSKYNFSKTYKKSRHKKPLNVNILQTTNILLTLPSIKWIGKKGTRRYCQVFCLNTTTAKYRRNQQYIFECSPIAKNNCTLYFYANTIWPCPPINVYGKWEHTGIVVFEFDCCKM